MEFITNIYYACYRFIDRNLSPIYYRFFGHKFHIIKTDLKPRAWIDSNDRLLYAVMSIVKWFVENDMRKFSEVEYLKEIERIINEGGNDRESTGFQLEIFVKQYDAQKELEEIAVWWNNYNNRQEEIRKALDTWYEVVDIDMFNNSKNKMTEEDKIKERELSDKLHDLKEKLAKEEQEMLKKAVELRNYMWS